MENIEKAELLIKLLGDEKFLAAMNDTENDVSKMKALFASKGVELSDDKVGVIIDALNDAKKSMYNGEGISVKEMENISGGNDDFAERAGETVKTIILAGGAAVDKVKNVIEKTKEETSKKRAEYAQKFEEHAEEGLDSAVQAVSNAADGIKEVMRRFVK